MADRQRWLWAVWRTINRNRWTFFGSFAVLTITGDVIVAAFLSSRAPGGEFSPPEFFVLFIILSLFAIFFWTAMALGNLWLERRGKALGTEAKIEVLAGARRFAESLKPPSLNSTIVVAVILGALTSLGSGVPAGLASGGTWLIVGVFVRWAWPKASTPIWRLGVASAMTGVGVFVLTFFWRLFEEGGAIKEAASAGGTAAGLAFIFSVWVKRVSSPSAHPLSRLALEIRDRALTLARDDAPPGDAVRDLLVAMRGRRPAGEIAWDILRKRPKEDLLSSRAWALLDRAIREGDWGWWPWAREPHVQGHK
jgi:hypothetical protein